jgi:hypothetical protein
MADPARGHGGPTPALIPKEIVEVDGDGEELPGGESRFARTKQVIADGDGGEEDALVFGEGDGRDGAGLDDGEEGPALEKSPEGPKASRR